MNTVSLELSKELYELSGWDDCDYAHEDTATNGICLVNTLYDKPQGGAIWIPAYDLGYLLRKLPQYMSEREIKPARLSDNRQKWIQGDSLAANEITEGMSFGKARRVNDNGVLVLSQLPVSGQWGCTYSDDLHIDFSNKEIADTPEDAACKLCIKLIKEGVIR